MEQKKFEYKIGRKILEYDIHNIDKEIEHMQSMKHGRSVQHEEIIKYCDSRINELNVLKERKVNSLNTLIEKYEKRV